MGEVSGVVIGVGEFDKWGNFTTYPPKAVVPPRPKDFNDGYSEGQEAGVRHTWGYALAAVRTVSEGDTVAWLKPGVVEGLRYAIALLELERDRHDY